MYCRLEYNNKNKQNEFPIHFFTYFLFYYSYFSYLDFINKKVNKYKNNYQVYENKYDDYED